MTDEWKDLLAPNEEILWQGQPMSTVRFEWDTPYIPFFFVFFTGFSVFWMIMASMAGGFFWTFGLLFFGTGMYNLVGVHFWKAYLRKQQFYTLTTQRALIGTTLFGKRSDLSP